MPFSPLRIVVLGLALLAMPFTGAHAQQADTDVQTAWRLLDYIAIDYGGAVSHGVVSSPSEYAEQAEFAETVATKVEALPATAAKRDLVAGVVRLQHAIADKAEHAQVAAIARGLAAALLTAYPVPLAPNTAPSFERGAVLIDQSCAACHGGKGDGHGGKDYSSLRVDKDEDENASKGGERRESHRSLPSERCLDEISAE